MKRFGVVNLLLAVLVGLAAWRTVGVWRRPVPEHELPPVDPASRSAPGEGLLAPPPRRPPAVQVVTTIAEHDLFDQSRKEGHEAAAEAPPPVPTPAPPPPTLKLAGVVVVGRTREALLVDSAQGNKHLRMRIGEDLMGYRVARIESERVALVGPGGEETLLELEIDKGGGKKAQAYGPGGKPQPTPRAGATPAPGAQPPPVQAGATPPTDPATDAKARAESARERLRRLRAEAAQK
ncbi:MAG: hypothetical protein ACKOCT_11035 [Alphaproteobacteria bacterium]